ncbi:MAG: MFS transporter, partial [Erysipelotrichaceae bacterium]|nr:MFS transporter [Erysipelotrichaceae bacterium]
MTAQRNRGYRNSYGSYVLMYVFYFLSMSIYSSLISVYLMSKGYSGTEVSLVVSGSFLSSMLLQPVFGILYDRYNIKKLNLLLFILAMISALAFIFSKGLAATIIIYSLLTILISATDGVIEKIATAAPFPYGRIRIWGTIGYALGVQCAGLIFDYIAPDAIYVTFIMTLILSTIGMLATDPDLHEESKGSKEPVSLKNLLSNRTFLSYLILTALITGCISAGHTYIPAMLTNYGMDASEASLVLSLATFCEA